MDTHTDSKGKPMTNKIVTQGVRKFMATTGLAIGKCAGKIVGLASLLSVATIFPALAQISSPSKDAPVASIGQLKGMRCDGLAYQQSLLFKHYNYCIPNKYYQRGLRQSSRECSSDFREFQNNLRPGDRSKWSAIRGLTRLKRCRY